MDLPKLIELADGGSDADRRDLTELITQMSSDERLRLLQAMQVLGDAYDSAVFDLHLGRKGGNVS